MSVYTQFLSIFKQLDNLTQTTQISSTNDIDTSDNDNTSESSEGELQCEDEEMPSDYESDDPMDYTHGDHDPDWNMLEEIAENEDSADDEENSDSGLSRYEVRYLNHLLAKCPSPFSVQIST